MSDSNTSAKSDLISESVTSMSPEQKFALFRTLGTMPEIQAMALHDKMVRNQQVEQKWNAEIEAVAAKLAVLDKVVKVLPHDQAGRPLTELYDEDIRLVLRKVLFDRKLRLIDERDHELRQL